MIIRISESTNIIIITRPWPAFGRPGLEWIIGWWPVRELYTSHASLRAFGAQLGRVHLSRVHFSRLASRLRRSARSNCARIGGNMKEFQHSNLPIFSRSVWKQEKWQKPLNLPTFFLSFQPSSLPGETTKYLEYGKCLKMGEASPISGHFLPFLLFIDTLSPINLPTFQHFFSYFKTQKCLEMGENIFSHF